jgi:excisionase family DNA binding protein
MEEDQAGSPAELIDASEAARLLEVPLDRIQVMVDEGMLAPAEEGERIRFVRSDVEAVRLIGG